MFKKLKIQKTRPDPNRVLKKSLIALMIGCFLLGMATRAEVENVKISTTTTTEESMAKAKAFQIKLVTVYEKTFDEEIIDAVFDTFVGSINKATSMGWKKEVFGTGNVTEEKVNILYPKVIITGKKGYPSQQKIRFLDKKGRVMKEVSCTGASKILISENDKFILKVFYNNKETNTGGGGILYDNDGKIIWSKEEGTFAAISDNGYSASGFVSPEGYFQPFVLYDLSGNKIKEFMLDYNSLYDAGGCFSSNYYVISIGISDDSTRIIVSTSKGDVLFDKILFGYIHQENISVIPGEGVFITDPIRLLDWEGNVIEDFDLKNKLKPGFIKFWKSKQQEKILGYVEGGELIIIEDNNLIKRINVQGRLNKLNGRILYGIIGSKIQAYLVNTEN